MRKSDESQIDVEIYGILLYDVIVFYSELIFIKQEGYNGNFSLLFWYFFRIYKGIILRSWNTLLHKILKDK